MSNHSDISENNTESSVKFYTNANKVERVPEIYVHQEYEYYIIMLSMQIEMLQAEIKEVQGEEEKIKGDYKMGKTVIIEEQPKQRINRKMKRTVS